MLQVSSRTMETSFYGDDAAIMSKERMRSLKKSMTLDLGSSSSAAKRQKLSVLSSPDLNLLKLASPELENLIIQQNNGQVTTTPTPTQFIFSKNVTEEQEMYARGFVDALAELHHGGSSSMDSVTTASTTSSGGGSSSTTTNGGGGGVSAASMSLSAAIAAAQSTAGIPHHIGKTNSTMNYSMAPMSVKEEPQTVPSLCTSPPLSPIDMLAQERIKLERKRQRNRVAASKCRKRKLERIARLEDKVSLLKDENVELGNVVTKLKEHICNLKQQLMDHVNSGCQIMTPSQYLS